jgi:hypothetical protein
MSKEIIIHILYMIAEEERGSRFVLSTTEKSKKK